MATITFEYYGSTGPAWTDIGANTLVFAGAGGITTPITVGSYQDETHIGSGDPGTDQCGANHPNNVKYIDSTHFSLNGGGSTVLNDTNLTDNDCTIRVHFNHTSSVAVTAARLFSFDGSTEANEAVNATIYAFERGVSATSWTQINSDSGNIGGDNVGERLTLGTKTAATDHYWYLALSMSPEAVGAINAMDFKVYLTYS